VLLPTSAALPQLEAHRHPHLGRLITPRHRCRLGDTLAARYPVAGDNDCFQGLNVEAVCRMLEAMMPWPSVARRVRRAWLWARPGSTWTFVGGGVPGEVVIDNSPLPAPHPNLLWIAVPDVVRCACGAPTRASAGRARQV
jgi:hypothetical protein